MGVLKMNWFLILVVPFIHDAIYKALFMQLLLTPNLM